MKKLILAIVVLVITGCNSEMTPERQKSVYTESANKYLSSKTGSKETGDILHANIEEISFIKDLTEKERELILYMGSRDYKNYVRQLDLVSSLVEVDKTFLGKMSDETNRKYEDFIILKKQHDKRLSDIESKDNKIAIGYIAYAKCTFTKKDGSKNKGAQMDFYFDLEHDLDGALMSAMYD